MTAQEQTLYVLATSFAKIAKTVDMLLDMPEEEPLNEFLMNYEWHEVYLEILKALHGIEIGGPCEEQL